MPRTLSRFHFVASLAFSASMLSAQPLKTEPHSIQPIASAAVAQDGGKAGKKDKVERDNDEVLPADKIQNPVLWQEPGDISKLDLFYGRGGEKHLPKPPFTFIAEDMNGTNPKMDVRDATDKKWRVKLGEESRPEVVASRLLWAMGYFTEEDYVLPDARIANLKMKRGEKLIITNDHVLDARFARKPGGQKKIGIWKWKENPFFGKREFNGLRVIMAVINDWDLKDVNNAVFEDKDNNRQIFLVSDTGATFATNTITNSRRKDKGNVNSYRKSKFITKLTDTEVDFGTPAPPVGLLLMTGGALTKDFMRRHGYDWIGDNIPRADARWIGAMLAQLSHRQLVDAFRAGNFPPEQIDIYVSIVEKRIQELKQL